MKVSELIEKLNGYDGEMDVWYHDLNNFRHLLEEENIHISTYTLCHGAKARCMFIGSPGFNE